MSIDDFNRVNAPRVDKLLSMLDTIDKSAKSNGVDPGQLLAPVTARLRNAPVAVAAPQPTLPPGVALPPGVPVPTPQTPANGKPHWSDLISACREAELPELMDAMMVIATRIQDEM